MEKSELKAITAKGEDSRLQFKKDIRNVDALASEMVAFSCCERAAPLLKAWFRHQTGVGGLAGDLFFR